MTENSVAKEMLRANTESLHEGLTSITREIRELKQEMKNELTTFKEEFKTDFRQEFNAFKEQIDSKLSANSKELQEHTQSITDTQTRTEELEEWNIQAKEALLQALKEQKNLKEKLTDLEGRSQRNNVRIFGVPEGAEGDSVPHFVESLLRRELALPEDMHLWIQRAHRATMGKPGLRAAPRYIIVNFLQFDTKEMLLKKAWQKRIKIDDKPIFFDHDYANEVVQKRKAYADIKKVLKERGIKFQTPLTRIKIHCSDGPKIYNSAREAAREMEKRGIVAQMRGDEEEDSVENRIQGTFSWRKVRGPGEQSGTRQRAREKLQEFRR